MADQLAGAEVEQSCVERYPRHDHGDLGQGAGDDQQAEQELYAAGQPDEGQIANVEADRVQDVENRIALKESQCEIGTRQLLGKGEHHQRAPDQHPKAEEGMCEGGGIGVDGPTRPAVVGWEKGKEQSDAEEVDALDYGDDPVTDYPERPRGNESQAAGLIP